MLLYITAEDVFGDAAPERREPRPPHSPPATLSALYDTGMRHHARKAVLRFYEGATLQTVPDWRLDRLVIRIALYCREKLGLEPGTRAVLFGRFGWLWPAAEFAVQGFGATAVGVEHDTPDAALLSALRSADPRLAISTDAESTARLLELRRQLGVPRVTLVAEEQGAPAGEVLPLGQLLELGGTLDTAERAQAFRMLCRRVPGESEALWHIGARGIERLSHARAIERVAERLRSRPPAPGDVVYLQPSNATLAGRLAIAALVGDGRSETVLGGDATSAEVARLRPHGLRVAADWLEGTCRGHGPRWPAGLDRRAARRRIQQRLGDRLRWVETERHVDHATAAALAAVGIDLFAEEQL